MKNASTPCFDAAPAQIKVHIAVAVAEALAPLFRAYKTDLRIAMQHVDPVLEAVAVLLHDAGVEMHTQNAGLDADMVIAMSEAAAAKASGALQ